MLKTPNSASRFSLGSRSLALAWLSIVVLASVLLLKQWLWNANSPIETDILKLLPKNQQNPVAEQAFESVSASLSDKVVFVLTATEKKALFQAVSALESGLRQMPHFNKVVGKISLQEQQAWSNYYFQHRFQFLTPEQRTRLSHNPAKQVQHVVQSLYNPFSGVTGQELQSDPFLLFRDYLTQVTQQSSSFRLDNGYLSTQKEGRQYLLVTAELNHSPYSIKGQQAVPDIRALEENVEKAFHADIAHTGVLFYADFGTQSAKSEISTIGVFSLLGIVFLFLFIFRSAMPLSLALLSIAIGLLVALSITTWIFGKVHLFSLVFGASLIGVSIDYAFHYLTERLAAGASWDSRKGLKHIFIAITLGLVTSLIGYLGMLVAPFPGLQQLALFSSIGLVAAYATVVAWYPLLASLPSHPNATLPGRSLLSSWLKVWQQPWLKIGLPTLCTLFSGYFLVGLNYNDDIHLLQAMPKDLKQQEALVTKLSGMQSSQQMLVVTAENNQRLLEQLESLTPTLASWQSEHVIEGYQSLHQYVSSIERQQHDHQLIRDLYANQANQLSTALQLSDLPELNDAFAPVTLEAYLQHPVSAPIRFLYLNKIEGLSAAIIVLNHLQHPEVVKAFTQSEANVTYLNKAEEVSSLFGEYRVKIMELLAAASAVILLVLIKRYGVAHSRQIFLPSLIACACGLATAAATGATLNLFNLLGLILILGIGIDYTLFFAEKARSLSTLLAITLSAITTVLSFGLLSLSQTHAIHSFGITVLSGIFVAWLLSPMAIKSEEVTS
ncbi:MMPL family transporter [Vibrio mytili]|uniref:MMPL family transporter n=1 Tax=Vibrio mytili TaxID=50718 RepID=UPI003C6F2A8F